MRPLKIFSVFDSKVGAFIQPMFFRSTPEAIRAFSSACSSTDHEFSKHAEDYTLFELGTWCDESGRFECLSTPTSICIALECISRTNEMRAVSGGN